MDAGFSEQFRAALSAAGARLRLITDERAGEMLRAGGWQRKQVLGHLIDSAVHNHVRFLTAASKGELTVASYDQQSCVSLHGYAEMPWGSVLDHWTSQNELLARVVDRIPAGAYPTPCHLPGGTTITLLALMEDYLIHLNQHVEQIS